MEHEYRRRGRRKRASRKKKNTGAMDVILVIVGISLLAFTVAMIQIFREYGIMGWIKTTKDRNKERKWEQEDRQEAKQEAQEQPRNDM